MGDRRPERALALGALDVDVDPLVVARDLGELVDVLLGHLDPIARADRLADQLAELVDAAIVSGAIGGAYRPSLVRSW